MIKITRPLIFFDLETTGINIHNDRIIQIAFLILNPDGTTETFCQLIDPKMPIDEKAFQVHGISYESLVGKPTFESLAPSLWSIFENADLSGFNIEKFDIPLLSAEFERCGFHDFFKDKKVIDAMTIFHKNERRDLPSAVRFYLNKEHVGAHDALQDVIASFEIVNAQIEKYGLSNSLDDLDGYCHERPEEYVDKDGKIVWRNGVATIGFGKNLGRTLQDLSENNPSYLTWILTGNFSDDTKQIIYDALQGVFPKK